MYFISLNVMYIELFQSKRVTNDCIDDYNLMITILSISNINNRYLKKAILSTIHKVL